MQQGAGFSPRSALAWVMGSLERRLSGALLLIVMCAALLQLISQNRSFNLHAEAEAVQRVAGNAEHAEELGKAINEFRFATHLYLMPGGDAAMSGRGDELTDAAMGISDQVNELRLSGVALYDLPVDPAPLDQLDTQVQRILRESRDPVPDEAARKAIEDYNAQLTALATAVENKVQAERGRTFADFERATSNWNILVTAGAGAVLVFAMLILFDLLTNLLPPLRRMHGSLRRLANGELDIEIENFRLSELRDLSGSLETFRRNALAVRNLAFTDPSTGMPNRRAFMDRVAARLQQGPREGEEGFAIFMADVDHFKHVNDDYGHAAGDRLAKLAGERMAGELGHEAIVARSGGDEFAIFLPLAEAGSACAIGSALVAAMRAPFDLGGFTVGVTISLGMLETIGGPDDCNVAALMHKADLALYASKNGGRNRASSYTSDLAEEREVDRELERDLTQAFDRDELRMVYQPIHPTADREHEVEALARWTHPQQGAISPSRFIPAAERSNQMVRLGSWIVERSLADLARWPDLAMSINLSPLQLQQDGFVGFLMRCCRKNGIVPHRVILEVTETLSIERNTRALVTLNLLRNAGFRIALDDFGTGYSSLCLMKTFKFDRLKLDRSLIADLARDPTSQAVFDAAVTMALRIGAEVVAEGISEAELVEPVMSAGCTHLQGFHYSRPIEADEVEAYFARAELARRNVA